MFTPVDPNYEERVRHSFMRQAAMKLIGARLTRLEPGAVDITLPYRPDLSQQHGYLHAGMLSTIADTAGGYAGYTLFPADSSVLTVEYKLNLLAPPQGVLLRAQAHVEHQSAGVGVARVEVVCGDGTTMTRCGLLTGTYRIGAA